MAVVACKIVTIVLPIAGKSHHILALTRLRDVGQKSPLHQIVVYKCTVTSFLDLKVNQRKAA